MSLKSVIVFLVILPWACFGGKPDVCSVINQKTSSLQLLQVVFRHGDRSPVHSYPTDTHADAWPQGLGQLTTVGMQQAYDLGAFMRNCYGKLVDKRFWNFQTKIRSTNYDRTLMTAECVAAGLYPMTNQVKKGLPKDQQPWSLGTWQPIPVQTEPYDEDKLMHPDHTCQYVHDLQKAAQHQAALAKDLINNKKLMLDLSHHTGQEINVTSLHSLSDTVFCQVTHNMNQPKWMTAQVQRQLLDYHSDLPPFKQEDAKYIAGSLLAHIADNMVEKENLQKKKENFRKMFLYSGHDSTVHPLMSLLGVANGLQVPYTGALFIELHHLNQKWFVRLHFRNDSEAVPILLTPDRCSNSMCPLHEFISKYEPLMLREEEYNNICVKGELYGSLNIDENVIPIVGAVLVVLMGLAAFLAFKTYKMSQVIRRGGGLDRYALLNNEGDDSSDSENEIFMIDETRDLYSAPTGHNISDTDGDDDMDEFDQQLEKINRDRDSGRNHGRMKDY